jgi:hypothetical protein
MNDNCKEYFTNAFICSNAPMLQWYHYTVQIIQTICSKPCASECPCLLSFKMVQSNISSILSYITSLSWSVPVKMPRGPERFYAICHNAPSVISHNTTSVAIGSVRIASRALARGLPAMQEGYIPRCFGCDQSLDSFSDSKPHLIDLGALNMPQSLEGFWA